MVQTNVNKLHGWRRLLAQARYTPLAVCLFVPLLNGCAGITAGLTQGFLQTIASQSEGQVCQVTGPAFAGLDASMQRQQNSVGESTKVLIVHGLGEPSFGYSERFAQHLTTALKLTLKEAQAKSITLQHPDLAEQSLGQLSVSRYLDETQQHELLIYELIWADVVKDDKLLINYDTTDHYGSQRANLNHAMKQFLNVGMADTMIYQGTGKAKITAAVEQAACWMAQSDWVGLPTQAAASCDLLVNANFQNLAEDDFIFVTYSLGSRIVVDMLQQIAERAAQAAATDSPSAQQDRARDMFAILQHKQLAIYMFANPLPLLELGRNPPAIADQIEDYCNADGTHYKERFLQELRIVAFSDPNDLMSYDIPPWFVNQRLDSRLCPKLANVILNVAPVVDVFQFGAIANPLAAHANYDQDARVIELITHGISHAAIEEQTQPRCNWVETI